MNLILPLIFTFLTCLPSLVGILFIKLKREWVFILTSLAVGTFLGAVFFKTFPKLSLDPISFYIVFLSLVFFMFLEEIIHWHGHFKEKPFGIINLLGDLFHNFMDGIAISSAFRISPSLGISFFFSVLFHEIPQEIGDFSVLILSGFSKRRAILLNFLVSLSAILGTLFGWYLNINPIFLISFVSGSFLYISMVDIIPLLRKEMKNKERIFGYFFFILGSLLMYLL